MIFEKKILKQNKIFELLIILFVVALYTVPLYFYGVEGTEDYLHTHFSLKLLADNFSIHYFFILIYWDLDLGLFWELVWITFIYHHYL